MLVTESFVFLHVPKTAGTFIQSVLLDHMPVVDTGEHTHMPYSSLRPEWRELPGLYVVRNPWDWYVSWFHWTLKRGRGLQERGRTFRAGGPKAAIWENVLRSGAADFREAVHRACAGDFEHPLTPLMRRDGLDLYSAYLRSIVGEALERPDYTALKFERLKRPLIGFLQEHTAVSPALARAIRSEPPRLASEHADYRAYYDDDLRELVGAKTRWIQDRFRYRFRASAAGSSPSGPGSPSGQSASPPLPSSS
jgi:hypothetical protein